MCLFPGASLVATLDRPAALSAGQLAERSDGHLLALAQREPASGSARRALDRHRGPRPVHPGRLAPRAAASSSTASPAPAPRPLVGVDLLIAEAVPIDEGDEGDEWGPAVEALARYLHAHAELRAFLEKQRRSTESMSWVNLACQHLPITASARQKLLEASAPERCLRISRGLDALLRKEQA